METQYNILLAEHGEPNENVCNSIATEVENALRRTEDGRVLVLVELADEDEYQARNFAKYVANGIPPSVAFKYRHTDNIDSLKQAARSMRVTSELYRKDFVSQYGSYIVPIELLELDDLHQEYKFEDGSPRLHVELEGEKGGSTIDLISWLRKFRVFFDKYWELDFDTANIIYRGVLEEMVVDGKLREDNLARRLSTYNGVYSDIIVRFGTCHTRIHHLLKSSGHISKYSILDDRMPNTFLFNPQDAIMRKMGFMGVESIEDFEWELSMIGCILYFYLRSIHSGKIEDGKFDQLLLRNLNNALRKNFKGLREINEFKLNAKSVGMQAAVYGFAHNNGLDNPCL